MIKVYIGEPLPQVRIVEVLYPNLGSTERATVFGKRLFEGLTEPLVEVVAEAFIADYILLPHQYNLVKNNGVYLKNFEEISKKTGKKIIVFMTGDSDEKVKLHNALVFRHSQYRSKLAANEIIMPAYVEDLGKEKVSLRTKSEQPSVGFCGWAEHSSFKSACAYAAKNFFITIRALFGDSQAEAHRKGLYFRRKSISVLKNTQNIETHFILRSSYTGNRKTIGLDPTQARREYIENIEKNDFTLAPKGDGNFSMRFYEALSLGRIPLLIDTECVLPCENEIDYSAFCLKVDYKDISRLGEIVHDFYSALSPEHFLEMQKGARKAFEGRLSIVAFFRYTMSKEFLERF